MEPRTALQDRFVAKFHFGDLSEPVSEEALDTVEAELSTRLPEAYRRFMTRLGVVHTPDILRALTEEQIDHPDIQDFLAPQQIIAGTKGYWSAGMPSDVIGIASDCMGNMIGFRRLLAPADDTAVVFFDHDFCIVRDLAPSFDDFLRWYLERL
jgi:hypothetical protein